MERYIEFNAVKFLKESKHWEEEKKELQDKLNGITEIKGIDNSPIRSGRLHDSVADVVAQRERIQEQIERIEYYQRAFNVVKKLLSEEENEIIDVFFVKDGYIHKRIRKFAREHGIRERGVYELRWKTVELVQKIINERFL